MLRDVLTDDARFVAHIADGPTAGPLESGDAVVDFISSTTATQHGQRRHVMTSVWRQGETAHAFVSLFETANGRTRVLTAGTYRTTVVETDGDARFSDIAVRLDGQD